ncbi:MAG: hypothetical protein RQ847_02445, partial [Wenzhouxiangellaceae bacterium]|nr:hypothetical protein [Wenzhouxiangellaceae bacterium]
RLPEHNLLWIILQRIGKGVTPANIEWEQIAGDSGAQTTFVPSEEVLMSFRSVASHLLSWEMWIGVAIGLALLAGAVWFRRRAANA